MTASVGFGRNHALIAFLLDPDLGILEGFAIGATHDALEGLAECGPGKNNRSRCKSRDQYSCTIKHEQSYWKRRLFTNFFCEHLGTSHPHRIRGVPRHSLGGGFQPRSRDAAQL